MIKCHSRERSYPAGIKWIAYSGFLFHYYSDPKYMRSKPVGLNGLRTRYLGNTP